MDAIYNTWGSSCSKFLFICRSNHVPTEGEIRCHVILPQANTYKEMVRYLAENYIDEYMWFVEASINSYVATKNLLHFLQHHNPEIPRIFGRVMSNKEGEPELAVGRILSKASMQLIDTALSENGKAFEEIFHKDGSSNSILQYLATTFSMELTIENVVGPDGLEAIIPMPVDTMRKFSKIPDKHNPAPSWYYQYNPKSLEGEDTVSRNWIVSSSLDELDQLIWLHHRVRLGMEASDYHPSEYAQEFPISANPGSVVQQLKRMKSVDWKKKNDCGKILVAVLTYPGNFETSAMSVVNTWAPYVDKAVFFTTGNTSLFEVLSITLNGPESRSALWEKVRKAWIQLYEKYVDQYDWFVKADDDTFLVIKNLKSYLAQFNPDDLHFFGRHSTNAYDGEYPMPHGGAGYILSRAALRKLGENQWALPIAEPSQPYEDWFFGHAMRRIEVQMCEPRGPDGKHAFVNPFGSINLQMKDYSSFWISAHYIKPQKMYAIYWNVRQNRTANGYYYADLEPDLEF